MENKKDFVKELGSVLRDHCYGIEKLEYFKPGKEYKEEVVVTYTSGYQQSINVSWDSISAMLRDIARNLDV